MNFTPNGPRYRARYLRTTLPTQPIQGLQRDIPTVAELCASEAGAACPGTLLARDAEILV
jgi:hypothetical protein